MSILSYDNFLFDYSIPGLIDWFIRVFRIISSRFQGEKSLHNGSGPDFIELIESFLEFSHLDHDSLDFEVNFLFLELRFVIFGKANAVGSSVLIVVNDGEFLLFDVGFFLLEFGYFGR